MKRQRPNPVGAGYVTEESDEDEKLPARRRSGRGPREPARWDPPVSAEYGRMMEASKQPSRPVKNEAKSTGVQITDPARIALIKSHAVLQLQTHGSSN
jgi:hypothetical protein